MSIKFVDHILYEQIQIPVKFFLFTITKNIQILDNKDFKIESLHVYKFVKETYYMKQ